MAALLTDIVWAEPLLPAVSDPAWEAEIRRRGSRVLEVDRRVAPNPWIRETCLRLLTMRPSHMPPRLVHLCALVVSQENACRYCYGSNRAYLKILGYSESFIGRIERDAHTAELDEHEHAVVAFCRRLARSRPRPAREACEALVAAGFPLLAVHELALFIALGCFYNRVSTFIAAPPEAGFERLANGLAGRLIGLAAPLARAVATWRDNHAQAETGPDAEQLSAGPFGAVLAPLAGLPGALAIKDALDGAFASPVLSAPAKALVFAVVARTLSCGVSEAQARAVLAAHDFGTAEVDTALATLSCARLPPAENHLLAWARDTVHYQTPHIQARTAALAEVLDSARLLEAIGAASLANGTVRLALLAE